MIQSMCKKDETICSHQVEAARGICAHQASCLATPGMCRGIWRTKDQMICEISDGSNQGIGFGHSDSAKVIQPSDSDSAKVIQQLSHSDSAKAIQPSYSDSAKVIQLSYSDSTEVSAVLFVFGQGDSAVLFGLG